MKPSQFLFQVGIFVLIAFAATPSEGNGYMLKQWMDSAKQVGLVIEPSVPYPHVPQYIDVVEITQNRPIKAAKCIKYNDLTAFSTAKSQFCPTDKQLVSGANYLPWFENKASFMLLDHHNWGIWFFTARLSGCDV